MSNESLAPTRRTLLTALGAVAVTAFAPLTAFAGHRHRGCRPPCRAGGISITDPPSSLVIDNPSGKTWTVKGSAIPFPNYPNSTNWRVIVTVQALLLGTGNVTPGDAVPAKWYGYDFASAAAGNFTIAGVVFDNGLPAGNIMNSGTMGPFYVSAVSQVKANGMWFNVDSGNNPLYGHIPTP
jgi:hypothetical protein